MRAFLALLLSVRRFRNGLGRRSLSDAADQADHSVPAGRHHRPVRPAGRRGLRAKLGQPVIVENKPGANGVIGLRELLKAEPTATR